MPKKIKNMSKENFENRTEIEPTASRNFMEMAEKQWERGHFVCVGLDTDWDVIIDKYPKYAAFGRERGTFEFNKAVINATKDLVAAYKPNLAFYEDSEEAQRALKRTLDYAKEVAPDVVLIADAKRGDIGNTNNGYVKEIFNHYKFDAVTVSPYLGKEALKPFLDRKDKGIIVLAKTSNPGADTIQELITEHLNLGKVPLYQSVAYEVANKWNENGNCCLVVGATYPDQLRKIRALPGCESIPVLLPGIGAQGGDVEATVNAEKFGRMFVNSSRGIIFAKRENNETLYEATRRETLKLSRQILEFRRV